MRGSGSETARTRMEKARGSGLGETREQQPRGAGGGGGGHGSRGFALGRKGKRTAGDDVSRAWGFREAVACISISASHDEAARAHRDKVKPRFASCPLGLRADLLWFSSRGPAAKHFFGHAGISFH